MNMPSALVWVPRNSSHNLGVIPAERAGARESRNPGNSNLDSRFRGNDADGSRNFSSNFEDTLLEVRLIVFALE